MLKKSIIPMLFTALLLSPSFALGADQLDPMSKLEAALLKLEEKLKNTSTTPSPVSATGQSSSDGSEKGEKVTESLQFQSKRIAPGFNSQNELAALATELQQLDRQLADLEAKTQREKTKIYQNEQVNEQLQIYLDASKLKDATINKVTLHLDDIPLIELDEKHHLWSSEQLPLYLGPLKPGRHSLVFHATIANKDASSHRSTYRRINLKDAFEIQSGKTANRIQINLEHDSNKQIKAIIDKGE